MSCIALRRGLSGRGGAWGASGPAAVSRQWIAGITFLLVCHVWASQALAKQVSLAWDASPSATVEGYWLYYGTQSHTYSTRIDVGADTTATVSELPDGQTYYFAITAYDPEGIESAFSNEVSTATSPGLTLTVNPSSVRTGDMLTLTARTTPASPPVPVDVYIALQLPGCTSPACLLFWQGGLNFTTTPQPILRNWPISPFDGPIFSYTFDGTEPVGRSVWLGAFTVPGTSNLIGEITQAPFTFSP